MVYISNPLSTCDALTVREHVSIASQSGLAFTANRRCRGSHLGRATCSEGRSVFASTAGSRRLIARIQTGLISRIDSAFVRLARYSAASRHSAIFSRAHLDRCPLFPFDFNAGSPEHLYLPSPVQRVSSTASFFSSSVLRGREGDPSVIWVRVN